MTKTDPPEPGSGDGPTQAQSDPRKPRGIRFSDPEWVEVKSDAESHGIPVAEFVREKLLGVARYNFPANSAESLVSLSPLIERTFRYTYMLATRMRDEMINDGKGKDLDHLVDEARKLQTPLLKGVSE